MKLPPNLTAPQILTAAERMDGTGFCTSCGHEQGGCEPDARKYPCEHCATDAVYGAEELLLVCPELWQ